MQYIIIANWKCNPTNLREAKNLFDSIKKGIKDNNKTEVVVCPPFVYLSALKTSKNVKLGGQDLFWKEKGAFTGEISPVMLKNLGCEYVIVGHSERRQYFGETDETINKKIKAALAVKISPIFCLGETREEKLASAPASAEDSISANATADKSAGREATAGEGKKETEQVLSRQIEKGLADLTAKDMENVIIAYEPVWAIGTGNPCQANQAKDINLLIHRIINRIYSSTISENMPVLYGGSVNSENAVSYIKEAGFQGLLVGGASLQAQEFIKIVKSVS